MIGMHVYSTVADPESLFRIPDPLSQILDQKTEGQEKGKKVYCQWFVWFVDIILYQCGGSGMLIPDPGSHFFPSRIPDPNCLHPGSRILMKDLSILTQKKAKWFLSS
jgi:hypothetical protein